MGIISHLGLLLESVAKDIDLVSGQEKKGHCYTEKMDVPTVVKVHFHTIVINSAVVFSSDHNILIQQNSISYERSIPKGRNFQAARKQVHKCT